MKSAKYQTVAAAQKIDLLKRYDAENMRHLSQRRAAEMLGVKPTTLNRWLKTRKALERTAATCDGKRKRYREGKCPAVDEALMMWFTEASLSEEPITRTTLIRKAREIAKEMSVEFRASDGWLTRWKERCGITKKNTDEPPFPDDTVSERWLRHTWQNVLNTYPLSFIYNVDEIAIYYKATPVDSMGNRVAKDRLTVLLACNLTGTDKLVPLVVGRTEKPKCLIGIQHLPVEYRSSENSWMTRAIFADFLKCWNSVLKDKIALLLYDSGAHPVIKLENIELIFLPPSADEIGLPLHQGVMKTWKISYRTLMRRNIIHAIEMNPMRTVCEVADALTILDGLEMVAEAWDRMLPSFIASCFNYDLKNTPMDVKEWDDEMDFWLKMDDNLETCLTPTSVIEEDTTEEYADREVRPVTMLEMRDAIAVLWRFMTQRREGGDFFTLYRLSCLMEDSFGVPKIPYQLSDYPISLTL